MPGAEPVVVISDGLWRATSAADPGRRGPHRWTWTARAAPSSASCPGASSFPNREPALGAADRGSGARHRTAAFGADGIARVAQGATVASATAEIQGLIGRLTEFASPATRQRPSCKQVGLSRGGPPPQGSRGGRRGPHALGPPGHRGLRAPHRVRQRGQPPPGARRGAAAGDGAAGRRGRGPRRRCCARSWPRAWRWPSRAASLGVAIAAVAVRVATRFTPHRLPRMAEVGRGPPGARPSRRCRRSDAPSSSDSSRWCATAPTTWRRSSGGRRARGAPAARERHRLRNGLVVTQVALALVLLVGSGLMFRSFLALRAVDPGFETAGVLTAAPVACPRREIAGADETAAFYGSCGSGWPQQPGVTAVGLVSRAPLGGAALLRRPGRRGPARGPRTSFRCSPARASARDPGYFEAMGIPVLEGRGFQRERRRRRIRGRVVVSKSFAEALVARRGARWGGASGAAPDEDWWEIVGVVGDVHCATWSTTQETVYYPPTFGPAANPSPNRTHGHRGDHLRGPAALVPVLRRELKDAERPHPAGEPPHDGRGLRRGHRADLVHHGPAGGGVGRRPAARAGGDLRRDQPTWSSQRTREIGVRMALGASAPRCAAWWCARGWCWRPQEWPWAWWRRGCSAR